MRIVLTGGHITPAIALTPYLKKKHDMLFLLRKHAYEGDKEVSFEYQEVVKIGIPFEVISAGRLERSFTLHTIPSLAKFPLGILQSLRILLRFRPNVVLSFGGYVALPVALAAFILGIPVVTHEQTVTLGLANRIISLFAKKVCVAFEKTIRFLPRNKAVLTGNPVRKELFDMQADSLFPLKKEKLPLLYIAGGSGGSHSVNMLIFAILDQLLETYVVVHQIGRHDTDQIEEKMKVFPPRLQERYIYRPYLTVSELSFLYRNARLLIGRSGANTVYEILTFGVPALLIPLPWAGASEQEANARLVEQVGLGKVVKQEGLRPEVLLSTIHEMVADSSQYRLNKQQAQRLVTPHAQDNIIAVLEKVGAK